MSDLSAEELSRALAYAGLVLVAFELVKSTIVDPIKAFYSHSTFGEGLPFRSYAKDVRSRHSDEFEACLLYLKEFMQAIDAVDIDTIQELRRHRNDLAHDLVGRLPTLTIQDHHRLFERVNQTLFKLSNYRFRMEVGADPNLERLDILWESAKGHEYLLFERIVERVTLLGARPHGA